MTDLRQLVTAPIPAPVRRPSRFNLAETDAASSASARTDRPSTAEDIERATAAREAARRAAARIDLGLSGAGASDSASGCCGGGCCS